MALTIDELVSFLRFKADDKGLKQSERGMRRARTGAKALARQIGKVRKAAIAAFGAMALGSAVKGTLGFVVSTNKEFEVLRSRLETVTGSASLAEAAFLRIRDFARKTPFEVANLVEAFTALRAVGIDATNERMTAFGDIAASFGRDITQMAMAVRGAVTGEFEMLKQFGIVARVEGEQLAVTFQGQTRRIRRDGKAIVALLEDLGKSQFAGGMERQSKTLAGVWSNLQDSAAELALQIGEQGLTDVLRGAVLELESTVGGSDELARAIGKGLAEAATVTVELLKDLAAALKTIKPESVRSAMKTLAGIIKSVGAAVKFLVQNWKTLVAVFAGGKAIGGILRVANAFMQAKGAAAGFGGALRMLSVAGGPIAALTASLAAGVMIMEHYQRRIDALRASTARLHEDITENARRMAAQLSGEQLFDRVRALDRKIESLERVPGLEDAARSARAERDILQQRLQDLERPGLERVSTRQRRMEFARERARIKHDLQQLERKRNKTKDDIRRINELRGELGRDPLRKTAGKKTEVSRFQEQVRSRVDQLAGEEELRAGQRALASGVSAENAEQIAKAAGQQRKAALEAEVGRGNLAALGGEFAKERQMMRDAGLLDEANRAAPPVLTVSINRFDVRVDLDTNVSVNHANASAADIGDAVGQAVTRVFRGEIREALENVVPRQRR